IVLDPPNIRPSQLCDIFYLYSSIPCLHLLKGALINSYGRILDIDLKIPPRPPRYAVVEFEDPHDADDAIYGRDEYNFDGYRLLRIDLCFLAFAENAFSTHVELAHSGRGQSYSYDRSSSYISACRGGVSRRSDFHVMVTGLPSSVSWQDLKDHMRRAGDVCFSDVYREVGVLQLMHPFLFPGRNAFDRLPSTSSAEIVPRKWPKVPFYRASA
ncbi:hypothetical protein ACJX0J_034031, partial [Zea mays]